MPCSGELKTKSCKCVPTASSNGQCIGVSKITKIYCDSGPPLELPVLFFDGCAPLEPLLRYQLTHRRRALSWHRRVVMSVKLLLDYAAANPELCATPQYLFENFTSRIALGTVDSGLDPSGLFWQARRPSDAMSICRELTSFSAFMCSQYNANELNPMREANWSERICTYAGRRYKSKNSFLTHLHPRARSWSESKFVPNNNSLTVRPPKVEAGTSTQFPSERFGDLILKGFAVNPHVANPWLRLNVRDVLLTLLLHGGGLRCSEPFHMFITDVTTDPVDPRSALVRIGHPSLGEISWRDVDGALERTTRAEYLMKHGLPQRQYVAGPMHAGWKNPVLDGKYYLQVRWATPEYGHLFLSLWRIYHHLYLRLRCRPRHPWAWVSFGKGREGEPLKLGRFIKAHDRAVRRIGLEPERHLGTKPHGHRHAYAKWLLSLGLSREIIRRFLHHASISSQDVYTRFDEGELNEAMSAGIDRLNTKDEPRIFQESVGAEFGFEGIDPERGELFNAGAQLKRIWEAQKNTTVP